MEISNDIAYVGVNDHDIDLFEGQYVVPRGMAYNSYLVKDSKTAVMDTVDARFGAEWMANVAAANGGEIKAADGWSSIFIYPPYKFAYTDAMLTNFHLPQSTLLMMISALAGRERILSAYAMAVRAQYKFFSYGDCMLIL